MQSMSSYPQQQSNAEIEEIVKYVEIPIIEEVIKYVPKKEIIEVEKIVPKYEYQTVEKRVEVPVVEYRDIMTEVVQIKEVIRHVPKVEVIDVPREVIVEVPRVEKKYVEQIVPVPGKVIEIPKPVVVEKEVPVPRYTDKDVPTVVAQQLQPVITESRTDGFQPEVNVYEPYLVPVDVYVPRGVEMKLVDTGLQTEEHRAVDIPIPQFNSLLVALNSHIDTNTVELPFVRNADGTVPMNREGPLIVEPMSGSWKRSHITGKLHVLSSTGGLLSYPEATFKDGQAGIPLTLGPNGIDDTSGILFPPVGAPQVVSRLEVRRNATTLTAGI